MNLSYTHLRSRGAHGSANSSTNQVAAVVAVLVLVGIAAGGAYHFRSSHKHAHPGSSSTSTFRIGYQKSGILNLQRVRGDLDKKLAATGVKVEWINFPAGPQIMEAIAVNGIDIGWTGDTPAVFAIASGNDIAYLANSSPDNAGLSRAVIVLPNSPIQRIADLKGKRVAVQKGSGAHNLLVQALGQAGVDYKEIHPVYLAPADARAAFESGAADAWAIWDPYLAIEQKKTGARTVANGKEIVTAGGFYLSKKQFARAHPDWIKTVLEQVEATSHWAAANPRESAAILAKQASIDPDGCQPHLQCNSHEALMDRHRSLTKRIRKVLPINLQDRRRNRAFPLRQGVFRFIDFAVVRRTG